MAKPIVFQWGDQDLAFQLKKVDRSKLYGYKEVEVIDGDSDQCQLATLADDGKTIVGLGGTGIGYVDPDGLWQDKASLQPVDVDGNPIQPVASSFDHPIKLFETATPAEFLSHNIRLVYLLESEAMDQELLDQLEKGIIFRFPYSYRGGLEADAGFLLQGTDNHCFLVVGNPTQIEFLGMQAVAALDDEEEVDADELLDFDMI